MSRDSSPAVVAAGAVCWRLVDGKIRVLLVHRDERADVSFPKGKLDPGETTPQAAVREIREETGIRVALGVPLGTIEYPLGGGREKTVHYWAAEVSDEAFAASTFSPNREIAGCEWLSIAKARKALSYPHDRDVLDRFAQLAESDRVRTFAVIALRHGKAVPPASWDGPDATRPLLHRGLEQAAGIAPAIAAFGPLRLVSSPAARCVGTIDPLARLTGLPVKLVKGLSQDAYEGGDSAAGPSSVSSIVAKRLAKQQTVVLCSHGPVLPGIIEEVARVTGTTMSAALGADLRAAANLSTAEFTVLHVSVEHPDGGLVAIETHSPPVV